MVRSLQPFLVAGGLAAATATLVNLVLLQLASAVGWWTGTAPTPMGTPIGVEAIVAFSVLAPLLGSVVAWVTMRRPGSTPRRFLAATVGFALRAARGDDRRGVRA